MMTTALLPSASLAGFLIFNLLDYRKFRELQGALSADCYPVQTSMTNRQLAKAGRRLGERALEGWPVAGELVTAISKHLQ